MGRNSHRPQSTKKQKKIMAERVLIVGGGGREHALAAKLAESPFVDEIYVAPGNAGTLEIGANVPLQATDIQGLANFAMSQAIDLTVVGPDDPLALGIVDEFQARKLRIFGPTRAAAQLESSKSWAGDFMARHGVPHGELRSFDTADQALAALDVNAFVVKEDGLAKGKGVEAGFDVKKAADKIREIANTRNKIVFQERLYGKELSVTAICDGHDYALFPHTRDHKRRNNGNEGPNTGGMGVYGPIDKVDAEVSARIEQEIIQPTLEGMRSEGNPFSGVLYLNLMLTEGGPKVIEYNARFGDPEAQVLTMLLESDIYPLLRLATVGRLADLTKPKFSQSYCVSVALVTAGYPDSLTGSGAEIIGLEDDRDITVFHGNTSRYSGRIIAEAGRVLHVAARAETLSMARNRVYSQIGDQALRFAQMHYRTDIAE
jgi:phosphoribosylamine--glycine ligase